MNCKKKGPVEQFRDFLKRKSNISLMWMPWKVEYKPPELDLEELTDAQPMVKKYAKKTVNRKYYRATKIDGTSNTK